MALGAGERRGEVPAARDCRVRGRGLHSSTFQLNLSRSSSLKPQHESTSQLKLIFVRSLPTHPTESAHVKPKSGLV